MDKIQLTWQTDFTRRVVPVEKGTSFREFLSTFSPYICYNEYASVNFNNSPLDFSKTIEYDGILSPILYNSVEGKRLYQQTLIFLVFIAWQKNFPNHRLIVGQSINDSVFFYPETPSGSHPFCSPEILNDLQETLKLLIQSDLPILNIKVPYYQAIDLLKKQNNKNAARLLQFRNDEIIELHSCDDILDLSSPSLLPNTGKIRDYKLELYEDGFLVRFPQEIPQTTPYRPIMSSQLFEVQKEFQKWSRILNLSNVGALDKTIANKEIEHLIQMNEMLHENKIAAIANQIHKKIVLANERKEEPLKLILIAGPSSSGKTTFTKKLALNLQVFGYDPCLISLDDYFLPLAKTPIGEDGKPDFESLYALNLPHLNQQLLQLFNGEEVGIPIFDFIAQAPKEETKPLKMGHKSILIMEGIHGLNPELTASIPREQKFLIYISALTQLKIDDHNRIPTSDGRLLRRMVRDAHFRGMAPEKTFELWPNVRAGEDKNIFPFQHNADAFFNSALNYEIPVLKFFASPMLRTIKVDSPYYGEALRFQEFLKYFLDIDPEKVPPRSILREFIGGSSFSY